MGNFVSKTNPKPAIKVKATKPIQTSAEETFGREIMKKIHLTEVPIKLNGREFKNESKIKINFNFIKRTELNQQSTTGTLSWQELPEIFKSEDSGEKFKIEQFKIEKIKKYFSLPIK